MLIRSKAMPPRSIVALIVMMIGGIAANVQAQARWFEAKSANFEVITNGSEARARRAVAVRADPIGLPKCVAGGNARSRPPGSGAGGEGRGHDEVACAGVLGTTWWGARPTSLTISARDAHYIALRARRSI
jgi:hypothetical protein